MKAIQIYRNSFNEIMCVGFQNWNPYKMPNPVEESQEMVKEKINSDFKRIDSVSTSVSYPKLSEWKSLSLVQLFATPWTMEFSRPEYWSG